MTYAVIVPWQAGCPHRQAAFDLVGQHLQHEHGGYVLAELPPDQPWCKGQAIAQVMGDLSWADPAPRMYGITRQTVLVLHDADVHVPPDAITAAVDAVSAGRARWAIPHGQVRRLTETSTAAVLAGAPLNARHTYERRYRGVEAGGIVCVAADLYSEAPFDPRLIGWGGDDLCAAIAWRCLAGPPWRGNAPLDHLFHPPQAKISPAVGSRASKLLHLRYNAAAKEGPDAVRALIAESGSTLTAMDETEARV